VVAKRKKPEPAVFVSLRDLLEDEHGVEKLVEMLDEHFGLDGAGDEAEGARVEAMSDEEFEEYLASGSS
jgi:hypothetical protein